MTLQARREYQVETAKRYARADQPARSAILNEFCATTGCHRKYAITLLRAGGPRPKRRAPVHRPRRYGDEVVGALRRIWEAAGYPWSVRLVALLPLWIASATRHWKLSAHVQEQLLAMSARTIDRALMPHKRLLRRNRFGRTKPGTLLKHHIPISTEHWDVTEPGFVEIDLVAHCGNSGAGEFINSLNLTDIHSTWVETIAVLGKGQRGVCSGIDQVRSDLPFDINCHLLEYCQTTGVAFTRGRPYKKNDNAFIEQKNWTHVRKILGWQRFDSVEALDAINDLYRNELRIWMNFFQPTVKLIKKERIGSKLKRTYDRAQTPLDRLARARPDDPGVKFLLTQRADLDPLALSQAIDQKLEAILRLANLHFSPSWRRKGLQPTVPTPKRVRTAIAMARALGKIS